jgi:hypothetical protein
VGWWRRMPRATPGSRSNYGKPVTASAVEPGRSTVPTELTLDLTLYMPVGHSAPSGIGSMREVSVSLPGQPRSARQFASVIKGVQVVFPRCHRFERRSASAGTKRPVT